MGELRAVMNKKATSAGKCQILMTDYELAQRINGIVWRYIHKGARDLLVKLNEAGFLTTAWIAGMKMSQYMWLNEALAGSSWGSAREFIYCLPLGLKRSDPRYKECMMRRKLAAKARIIHFGSLSDLSPEDKSRTFLSYVVFRVESSNVCLVHLYQVVRMNGCMNLNGRCGEPQHLV